MEEVTRTRSFKDEGMASRRAFLRSYPLRWEEEEEEEDGESPKGHVAIRNKKRYSKVKSLVKNNLVVVLQWGEEKLLLLRKIKTRFPSTSISLESKRTPWFSPPEEEEEEEGHKSHQATVKSLMKNNLIGVLHWGEEKILLLLKTKAHSPSSSHTIHFDSKSISSFSSHELDGEGSDHSPQGEVASRDMRQSSKVKFLMKSNLIMVLHWGEGKLLILRKIKRQSPSTLLPSIHLEEEEEEKEDESTKMKSNLVEMPQLRRRKLLIQRRVKIQLPLASSLAVRLGSKPSPHFLLEEKGKEGDSPQSEVAYRDNKQYSKLTLMKSNIKDMLQWGEGKLPLLRKIKTRMSSNSSPTLLLDSEHPASVSQLEKKEEVDSTQRALASRIKLSYSKVKSFMKRSTAW